MYANFQLPYMPSLPQEPPALPPRNVHFQLSTSQRESNQAPRLVVDEQSAVELLQPLNRAELESLLENDDTLKELVNDLQQVKNIQVDRETMLASNKSLAEDNLKMQPCFSELKQQIAGTYAKITELKTVLAKDKARLDVLVSNQSLETTLALLQTEAAKSEEETEAFLNSFLDKKVEADTFIDEYIRRRTLANVRKIKAEKMAELLKNRQVTAHQQVNSYNWNQAPPQQQQHPTTTPYPTGNFYGMPNPGLYFPS